MEISSTNKPDYVTFAGLALALAGILGGLLLEKGSVQDLQQLTALLIVFGGTAGAVMISTPAASLLRALKSSRVVFFEPLAQDRALADEILGFAVLARRRGIAAIETQAEAVVDPFFRKGLLLAVDGIDTQEIRRQLELEIRIAEDRIEADARVFESAGGYSPTIGIIGAVLGLIQVMKHLDNLGEVGRGIAVAFVATVYGVGLANLILLPAAAKIRGRGRLQLQTREMTLEGVLAIAEGLNPHLIRMKLNNYLEDTGDPAPAAPKTSAAQQPTPANSSL